MALQNFVQALQSLADFDSGLYAKRLLQASKSTSCLGYFPRFQPVAVGQNGMDFDGANCSDHINILAAASTARCLSQMGDDYGFHSSVDQNKAKELSKKMIAKLISYMYGDHVNKHLAEKGVPTLGDLRKDAAFVDSYHKMLLSSPFDHNALAQNVGRNYTIALLFCYEYFKHGPGFDLEETLSAENEDMKHWIEIFRAWIVNSQDPEFKRAHPNFRIEQLIPSTGAIFKLNGYPDQNVKAIGQHLQDRIVGDCIKWEITEDIAQYKMLGEMIWASWDSATLTFESSVQAAVNEKSSVFNPGHSTGDQMDFGSTTENYGDTVDQYMQNFWNTGLFASRANNRSRFINHNAGMLGSCFRPGTKVLTLEGSKEIEKLKEGDCVLTKGGKQKQWGWCSDERVAHSTTSNTGRTRLYGFNGGRAFFSPSHVFHTTTGLRAVDPILAKRENPWLEVGRLQVGHSLIFTDDGTLYRPVQIEKITSEIADCDEIYGVHLREGLRSYHADGYLVHLNYPEITIKSISSLLQNVKSADRYPMLQNLAELRPLFERFGAQTAMDALNGQLQDAYTDKHPLVFAHDAKEPLRNAVEHLRRTWDLQNEDPGETSPLELPSVETFEGVLTIDGSYCENASVKKDTMAWSRHIPQFGWEHGFIRLDSSFMFGHGQIYYSPDFEAFDAANGRHIVAIPTKRKLPPELVARDVVSHPSVQAVLGGDTTSPMPLAKSGTFIPQQVEAVLGTAIQLPVGGIAEESVAAFEAVVEESTAPAEDDFAPPLRVETSHQTASRVASGVASAPATAQTWENIDNYILNYDMNGWPDNPNVPVDPQPYCQLFTSIDPESKTFLSRIPELDAIRDAGFANAQSDMLLADVAELYQCYKTKAPVTGDTVYELRCTRPQLIAQLADDFDHLAPRYNNLTFKNLGLDITLPFVFSIVQLKLSFDAQSLTGIIRAFDPSMLGDDGKRYRLVGQYTDTPDPIVRAFVASSTSGSIAGAPLAQMTTAHSAPPLTLLSEASSAANQKVPTQDETGAQQLYEMQIPSDLTEKTQKLIYNTMRFHMTDDDHKTFIGIDKPDIGDNDPYKVPQALGPNLEESTRKWLQDKYIPAWISQRVCNIADASKEFFRKTLSNSQRKKLEYWWNGRGSSCMAQSDSYNRLNALASYYATLWACPNLRDFKKDTNPGTKKPAPALKRPNVKPGTESKSATIDTTSLSGGKRWAAALYNLVGTGPKLHELASSIGSIGSTKDNQLQKLGNILQVLDPIPIAVANQVWTHDNTPLCVRLTENIRRYRTKMNLTMAYTGTSSLDPFIQNEYTFLCDALRALYQNLMEEKQGFNDEVTAQVQEDMKALQKQLEIDQKWTAAKKAQITVELCQEMIFAGATFSRANSDFKIGEKIGQKWNGFRGRGVAAAVATADYARQTAAMKQITDEVKAARVKALMYSSMVVVTLAMYLGSAVAAFKSWSVLEPADQAKLVLGAVQQSIYTMGASRDAYKAILDFKDQKRRFVAAASLEQSLTQDMRLAENQIIDLFGEEVAVHPDLRLRNMAGDRRGALHADARGVNIEMGDARNRAVDENIDAPEQILEPNPEPGAINQGGGKRYNWKGNRLKIALVALGVALVVAECFSIYQNWGRIDAVTAGLSIASLVVQALSVIVEGIVLAAEIGFQVASGLMTACTFAGPILAVVGVVLMILLLIWAATRPPPLSPSEKWMEDRGFKFVDSLPDPPSTNLRWLIQPDKFIPNVGGQSLLFTGINTSSKDVTFAQAQTSFTCGSTKSALFSDDSFELPTATGTASGRFECTASSPELRSRLNFAQLRGDTAYGDTVKGKVEQQVTWQLFIKPNPVASSVDNIVLKPGEWMAIRITGTPGPSNENQFYAKIEETNVDGDKPAESKYISRKWPL